MAGLGISGQFGEQMAAQLRDMQLQAKKGTEQASPQSSSGPSFLDHLQSGVKEVDSMQKTSDKMGVEVASGKSQNLHETMLVKSLIYPS